MGKRKERRLAAMSNSGRRVKLDLFAEPSGGDLGGSSVNDGVGEDIDSKPRAGLPNSPSSSGQRPENPLLLLGQYSDDELEDDLDEKLDNATGGNSLVGINDEAEVLHGESRIDLDVNASEVNKHEKDKDSSSPDINQNLDDTDKRESDAGASTDLGKDLQTGQVAAPVTSDLQQSGDVGSGWQIVMHEESNQYYYWNTETGETSWEMPEVLAQTSELADNHNTAAVTERTENVFLDTQDPNLSSGLTFNGLSAVTTHIEGSHPVEWGEVVKNESLNDTNWDNNVVNSSSVDATLGDGSSVRAVSDKFVHGMIGMEDHESGMDLSSSLVKHSESLIERLKSVKGSDGQLQSLDRISKYIIELEIRLSDIKSLSSFGSSLHQFWVHSERQLKQLEDSINAEFSDVGKRTHVDDKIQESTNHKSEAGEIGNRVYSENSDVSTIVNTSTIFPKDLDATDAIPNMHVNAGEQVNGTACSDELNPKQGLHAAEDVDMDVDMEVDDASSAGNTTIADASGAQEFAVLAQSIQPIQPAEYTSVVSDEVFTVPPLPDEEWIPPPPPDNEQIPPPPPDEPLEPVYPPPPSYPETGPPPPYAEQFNLSYQNSGFEYYGHAATEVPSSNFYGHAPVYYGAVPNTYTETPQITANPITAVAYYELQDAIVPPAPGVSSAESSQLNVEPAPVCYETFVSDHIGPVHSLVEAGGNTLPPANDSSSSAVGGETDRASLEVLSTTATVQAPAIVSAKESVSLPSTTAASATSAVSASSMATKKVTRGKKRTVAVAPSLRSNKKVSSLVNKWKAAKEELLEDEEEPENAYEMLERKRQKEIEEWRAQQIASGEAKDNANFQPLGGDWRERVKRRRAQLAKEAAQTSPESRNDENQQPDLTELSRDLPSGWQAYWDESSKQVYYGNIVTSDTTWIKPTK
ncbi:WW domain containing protein [Trema orientale]|uniref:WW domain containing protein n=1 Tax=Trema orientale TaxID=63057 RepID=A0A2P5ELE7_TREOI|nr:WW domain containing protein [Trema orientale]